MQLCDDQQEGLQNAVLLGSEGWCIKAAGGGGSHVLTDNRASLLAPYSTLFVVKLGLKIDYLIK